MLCKCRALWRNVNVRCQALQLHLAPHQPSHWHAIRLQPIQEPVAVETFLEITEERLIGLSERNQKYAVLP